MNIASLPMLASCSILLLTLLCSDAGVPQRVDLQQEADALQAYVALSEQQTYVGKAAGNVDKDFEEEENEPVRILKLFKVRRHLRPIKNITRLKRNFKIKKAKK